MALTAPDLTWRVHAVLPATRANGPGTRFAVWVQGCSLGCAGCFNPGTHPDGGSPTDVQVLVDEALARTDIEGVTLTGGEPLEQPAATAAFCERVAAAGLGVLVLTGFTRAEIERDPAKAAAVRHADLVIAGRYNRSRHVATGLRGSDNKEYWARTDRYHPADLERVPELEILSAPDGTLIVTGMAAPRELEQQ